MDWTLVSAVNRDEVVRSCLLGSPEVPSAGRLILQRGYATAADAYNKAIDAAPTDLIVIAHQDVFFPAGWTRDFERALWEIAETVPNWGVLGVWGALTGGGSGGLVYDGGWSRVLGTNFEGGSEVCALDEVVLILRKSSGLRFDPNIPGFHMYGADICLEARKRGMKCYAISAFCIHNTNQYGMLPWAFWKAYLAMRRKWKDQLPVRTTCTEITRWCWPMLRWNLTRAINLATGRDKPPARRVQDPKSLYEEMLGSGTISSVAHSR